jgi:predicted AAA+ superfamily ATPase
MVYPFFEKEKRNHLSAHPKFYFFDVGVANFICRRECVELKSEVAGKSLEHYVLTELKAFQSLHNRDFEICFWRTTDQQEVDFVLKRANVAIECKISHKIQKTDVQGLLAFAKDFDHYRLIMVCLEPEPRILTLNAITIEVMPIRFFLEQLWGDHI